MDFHVFFVGFLRAQARLGEAEGGHALQEVPRGHQRLGRLVILDLHLALPGSLKRLSNASSSLSTVVTAPSISVFT